MKNVILWVEDAPDTVADQVRLARSLGFVVKLVATAQQVLEKLQKHREELCLIIIDPMLLNIYSLEAIGISNSSTELGYEAGWVLLDRFIRPEEPAPAVGDFKDIPVLVVSSRPLDSKCETLLCRVTARGGAAVQHLEKNRMDDQGTNLWRIRFDMVIREIAKTTFPNCPTEWRDP